MDEQTYLNVRRFDHSVFTIPIIIACTYKEMTLSTLTQSLKQRLHNAYDKHRYTKKVTAFPPQMICNFDRTWT